MKRALRDELPALNQQQQLLVETFMDEYGTPMKIAWGVWGSYVRMALRRGVKLDDIESECHLKLCGCARCYSDGTAKFVTYVTKAFRFAIIRLIRSKRRIKTINGHKKIVLEKDGDEYSVGSFRGYVACELIETIADDHRDYKEYPQLRELMRRITERERVFIQLRYGFFEEPMTYREIGSLKNVSIERARQIVKNGIRRLQNKLLLDDKLTEELKP